jgi:hypothetical protein
MGCLYPQEKRKKENVSDRESQTKSPSTRGAASRCNGTEIERGKRANHVVFGLTFIQHLIKTKYQGLSGDDGAPSLLERHERRRPQSLQLTDSDRAHPHATVAHQCVIVTRLVAWPAPFEVPSALPKKGQLRLNTTKTWHLVTRSHHAVTATNALPQRQSPW